jgi:hypothetical protein
LLDYIKKQNPSPQQANGLLYTDFKLCKNTNGMKKRSLLKTVGNGVGYALDILDLCCLSAEEIRHG